MPIHSIHAALDSKNAPELQHTHMHGNHAESVCACVIVRGIFLLEILKAVATEMMAMRGISP